MKLLFTFFFSLCCLSVFSQNDYDRKVTIQSKDGNKESVLVKFRCIPNNLKLQHPLVLVDDVPTEVTAIPRIIIKEIDRIEVRQGEEAIKRYGVKAKGGVVLIYMKASAVKRAYI